MKRKTIILIAVFFMLAISGLIVIQIYWIGRSISIKDEQLRVLANKSLNTVALELEREEVIARIFEEIGSETNDSLTTIISATGNMARQLQGNLSEFYLREYFGISEDGEPVTINNEGQRIIISTEQYPVLAEEEATEVSASTINASISGRVNAKILLLENIMDKIFRDIPGIRERVDPEAVNKLLGETLKNAGILLDYEFAIKTGNSVTFYKSAGYTDRTTANKYLRQLFPNDPVPSNHQLTLYFTHEKQYSFQEIGAMGLVSLIITLLLLFMSGSTFYVIFRQKRISEIRTDFINNMTHELKTPISTISLASQMIGDKSIKVDEKRLDELSRIIGDESNRLRYLVEKVLQMAVFEKVRIKLKMKDIDLHSLIETVVNSFRLQIESHKGTITTEFLALNSIVEIDEVHFYNVISNLIDNAIKYSPERIDITILTRPAANGIELEVSDKGEGISNANKKRVFEKFFRVPSGNLHRVKGTGLGLSYVKKIVEEHKGSVRVESRQGYGSRFIIFIPIK